MIQFLRWLLCSGIYISGSNSLALTNITPKPLTILIQPSLTTVYTINNQRYGFEYDLTQQFGKALKRPVKYLLAENKIKFQSLIHKVDFVAGWVIDHKHPPKLTATPSYFTTTPQLIVHKQTPKPKTLSQILNASLEITANSHHSVLLQQQQQQHPQLHWAENPYLSSSDLLWRIREQSLDATLADAHLVSLYQRFQPNLKTAFSFPIEYKIAWGFLADKNPQLYQQACKFITTSQTNGLIKELIDKYYAHIPEFDFVETRAFVRAIKQRLPKYRHLFQKVAKKYQLNWHLLAAISYQESHWRVNAESPTGVKGLMMLTKATAKQIKIKVADRTKPEQSITGGARYIKRMKSRLPKAVKEPNRTWLALVAYNIGFAHLIDARKLTQQHGKNPNSWYELKTYLAKLSDPKWHRKTKYGFAPGKSAIKYVNNIKNYYEILLWLFPDEQTNS